MPALWTAAGVDRLRPAEGTKHDADCRHAAPLAYATARSVKLGMLAPEDRSNEAVP